jgi:hypothetical protein
VVVVVVDGRLAQHHLGAVRLDVPLVHHGVEHGGRHVGQVGHRGQHLIVGHLQAERHP